MNTPVHSLLSFPSSPTALSKFLGTRTHRVELSDGLQICVGEAQMIEDGYLRLRSNGVFFEGDEVEVQLDFDKKIQLKLQVSVIRQIHSNVYKVRLDEVDPLGCYLMLMNHLCPESLEYNGSDGLSRLFNAIATSEDGTDL